ncbi:MAG: hypothetical protein EBT95_09715, partial [Verrucomicrobia bacterium]|nr:hypothetical protein [Verrucomicrobiota bacterium]
FLGKCQGEEIPKPGSWGDSSTSLENRNRPVPRSRDDLVNPEISPWNPEAQANAFAMISHAPTSRIERHFELMEEIHLLETRMTELLRELQENAEQLERLSENLDEPVFADGRIKDSLS